MKNIFISALTLIVFVVNTGTAHAQLNLEAELNQLEAYIAQRDSLAPDVSAVDVAWHLDHSLKMIIGIYSVLKASDPLSYSSSFKPVRTLVFTTGRMPRGVGKAPKSVLPPENIRTEDIMGQLEVARSLLPAFSQLDKKKHFNHYVFGVLNVKRSARFVKIHTRHHLRIVRDILKKSGV